MSGGRPRRTASRTAAPERHPFPALPPGWAIIGRCRFGTGMPGPDATGCYALAHPDVGIALIDIAPDATPNAEARLRRALTAVEFWPDYPGTLPVVHDRVDGTALRSLPWVLERGFAAQPVLTIPGGTAWIEGVQRAMAADPAWELPGQPKAQADAPPAPADEVEGGDEAPPPPLGPVRPRRWGRLAALPLAFAATFAIGLVAGFVLLDSPAPVAPQPVVATAAPPARACAHSAVLGRGACRHGAESRRRPPLPPRTAPAATTPSVAGTPTPAGGRCPCARARSGDGAAHLGGGHSRSRVPADGTRCRRWRNAAAGAGRACRGAERERWRRWRRRRAPATSHSPMETQVSHARAGCARAARGAAASAGAAAGPGECCAASGAARRRSSTAPAAKPCSASSRASG